MYRVFVWDAYYSDRLWWVPDRVRLEIREIPPPGLEIVLGEDGSV